jgi:hypothetical protein
MPVVAIAAGVSSIAIVAGGFALAVPGLILWSIWAVVAQTAALEGGSWIDALRRSATLTRGYRWHALGLLLLAALIAGVPWVAAGLPLRHTPTTGALFVIGTGAQVLFRSFEALITAVLYFDLRARPRGGAELIVVRPQDLEVPTSEAPSGAGDPLTPAAYTDQNRPPGWYVVPADPKRMSYWAGGSKPAWSQQTAKTPKQTLVEWEELTSRREED